MEITCGGVKVHVVSVKVTVYDVVWRVRVRSCLNSARRT